MSAETESMNLKNQRMLVISGHAVDFVWRCGGAMARYARAGAKVRVITLTFGERGESGEVWSADPSIGVDAVKRIRRQEAEAAATILGAELRCLDFDDHPMVIDQPRLLRLVGELRDFRPTLLLIHHDKDPLNTDHIEAYRASLWALRCAQVPGVEPGSAPIGYVQIYTFEPQQPEFCEFNPDLYIDITDVMPIKRRAMEAVASQAYTAASFVTRAEYRAQIAQRICGNRAIRYAETFKRFEPRVATTFD
jgi:4-oxalomesaconate hydratase